MNKINLGKKLIVCDLDGTLLDKIEGLSKNFAIRLNKLIKNGLDFTISTGRDYENTKKALKYVKFKNPIILTNGALLVTYPKCKILNFYSIENKIIQQVLLASKEFNLKPMVIAFIDLKKKKTIFLKGNWSNPYKLKFLEEKDYIKYISNNSNLFISIQFCEKFEKLNEFKNYIENLYKNDLYIILIEDAFLKNYFWLEFNDKRARKEEMLKILIQLKGYKYKDVIVFGDELNDLGSFELAGIKIAVANANPLLKQKADIIIETNKNGGVISYLEENIDNLL